MQLPDGICSALEKENKQKPKGPRSLAIFNKAIGGVSLLSSWMSWVQVDFVESRSDKNLNVAFILQSSGLKYFCLVLFLTSCRYNLLHRQSSNLSFVKISGCRPSLLQMFLFVLMDSFTCGLVLGISEILFNAIWDSTDKPILCFRIINLAEWDSFVRTQPDLMVTICRRLADSSLS